MMISKVKGWEKESGEATVKRTYGEERLNNLFVFMDGFIKGLSEPGKY